MRKTEKRVLRRKTNKRRTKKQKKNNRKKTIMKGGFDIVPQIKAYLNSKIKNKLQCEEKGCKLNTTSKSDQIINICDSNVYKQPPQGYNNFEDIDIESSIKIRNRNYRVIKVNPHTMNLFIQSVFKDKNIEDVEKYEDICMKENKPAMNGTKYEHNGHNSLTDYIKDEDTKDVSTIITQMQKICAKLQYLYDNFQFHHCDPKADQIFLNGTRFLNGTTFILGDLDKVTFSMKYTDNTDNTDNKEHHYRVRLSQIDGLLRTTGFRGGRSQSESMRFDNQPRAHCDFEKCAFIASLMLSANDDLYNNLIQNKEQLLENVTQDNATVNWDEIDNKRKNQKKLLEDFDNKYSTQDDEKIQKKRKDIVKSLQGHKEATMCVILKNNSYADEIKSDFDISKHI
jgi:hypothetical protein